MSVLIRNCHILFEHVYQYTNIRTLLHLRETSNICSPITSELCIERNQSLWIMVMKIIKVCACHQHTVRCISVIGDEGNFQCGEPWSISKSWEHALCFRWQRSHLQTDTLLSLSQKLMMVVVMIFFFVLITYITFIVKA